MDDKLCFIQFIHPGGEHEPEAGGRKAWNSGDHCRKFLRSPGRFVAGDGPQDGEIVFWGEWEPESQVIAEIENPLPDGPRWVYDPYYVPPTSYHGLQNTDPFVFGERFFYTGCKQHTRNGPTQLRHLTRGTVILFGSCRAKSRFVVDTVFVVANYVDHHKRDYQERLRGRVSATYETVTLAPWYDEPEHQGGSYRLYEGATFDAPVEGMFSFFPCLPSAEHPQGFARPTIRIPDVITDALYQGKKLNPQANIREVKRLWDKVALQVASEGLARGISAALPPAGVPKTRMNDTRAESAASSIEKQGGNERLTIRR